MFKMKLDKTIIQSGRVRSKRNRSVNFSALFAGRPVPVSAQQGEGGGEAEGGGHGKGPPVSKQGYEPSGGNGPHGNECEDDPIHPAYPPHEAGSRLLIDRDRPDRVIHRSRHVAHRLYSADGNYRCPYGHHAHRGGGNRQRRGIKRLSAPRVRPGPGKPADRQHSDLRYAEYEPHAHEGNPDELQVEGEAGFVDAESHGLKARGEEYGEKVFPAGGQGVRQRLPSPAGMLPASVGPANRAGTSLHHAGSPLDPKMTVEQDSPPDTASILAEAI